MAHVRTVKTASGATAVQIVYPSRRGSRKIDHLGSGHTSEEVEALKAAAVQRLAAGQAELDLGLSLAVAAESGGPAGDHQYADGASVGRAVPGRCPAAPATPTARTACGTPWPGAPICSPHAPNWRQLTFGESDPTEVTV